MQERFEFLARYRHTVPEEDFEVAMKAYEWPKKFVSIMKEAATKATSGMLLDVACFNSCVCYTFDVCCHRAYSLMPTDSMSTAVL